MKTVKSAASVGRPREFDPAEALDKALKIFWQKGYEGTSLTDLTESMGINRPSLYAAFGNKEALFRKALDRYAETAGAMTRAALAEPTARGVVEQLLRKTAEGLGNPSNPRGCLAVQAALACGEEADPVKKELIARRCASEKAVRDRLERAKAEGDLPASSDPGALAGFIAAVQQGMSVKASSGASGEELKAIAEVALQAWPV
ncbi:MAG: TetR family transcriptional regulator [Akkermansiaceae bacterium]|nr:TetR family transcriptional regulator [Akkermansiaceae bacterium]